MKSLIQYLCTLNADTGYLQRRVSSTCAVGSSIRAISSTGTVTCETDSVNDADADPNNEKPLEGLGINVSDRTVSMEFGIYDCIRAQGRPGNVTAAQSCFDSGQRTCIAARENGGAFRSCDVSEFFGCSRTNPGDYCQVCCYIETHL